MTANAKKWILVLAGVVAGHQLAHAFAHDHANASTHGYVTAAGLVFFPLALFVMLDLARREAESGVRAIRVRDLLVAQAAVFFAQELSEAAVVGAAPIAAVADPILWLGVLAQLAVAGTLLSFVAAGRRFLDVSGRRSASERVDALRAFLVPRPSHPVHRYVVASLPAPRGPPVFV